MKNYSGKIQVNNIRRKPKKYFNKIYIYKSKNDLKKQTPNLNEHNYHEIKKIYIQKNKYIIYL